MKLTTLCISLTIGLCLVCAPFAAGSEERIDFTNDIQPILTKLGCNQGACHGAQNGKGGFTLSLRGFDDRADYYETVKGAEGRRVLLSDPTLSLLVSKPTLEVPHKGGKRLEVGSWAYDTLIKWMEQGAPGPSDKDKKIQKIVITPEETILKPEEEAFVEAKVLYTDGTEEFINHKASFDSSSEGVATVTQDGLVTATGKGEAGIMVRFRGQVVVSRVVVPYGEPEGLDSFTQNNLIDELWVQKWRKIGLSPTKTCSDEEFFRRIYIDTIGTLPTPEEVKAFLADKDPQKRNKAIDTVLDRPEYVDFWAYKWGDLLRNNRNSLQEKGMWSFHNWIRASFRDNKPMHEFVNELITAVGSPYQNGPANFYKVGNNATDWAENATQVFLGVRLQCARCHHHPFENYSQADFYGMVAFFSRVGTKNSQEFGIFGRDTVIYTRDSGDVRHPRTGQVMQPTPLGGEPVDDPLDRRRGLAKWLSEKNNPALAINLVNRYWGYYMGRGLIDPIDDIRSTNPASCPEVLDGLAKDLIDHNYDIKHLLRTIMRSNVYQLSSVPHPASEVDAENKYFTRYTVKRMTAEQLLDAIDFACATQEKFSQLPAGYRAISLPDANVSSRFLDAFGRPKREMACECERSDMPNMTQALQLMTGNLLNSKVFSSNGRVAQMIKNKTPLPQAIEELYLCTVSRPPRKDEIEKATALVAEAPSPKEGLEDLLWTLLNTREFQFNH